MDFPKNRFQDVSKKISYQDIAKGGYLKEIDLFDYDFFNLDKVEAEKMYPGNRLLLEAAVKTVMNAGYHYNDLKNKRVATFVVQQESEYHSFFRRVNKNSSEASYLPMAGTRIANFFKWKGPVTAIDTACSSSLSALYYACQSIKNNDCDAAFVCGEVTDFIFKEAVENHPIYSKNFKCSPYDKDANGTFFGEGVMGVLIKPLDNALKDNDSIYAVVKGGALNRGEMASKNISVPKAESQTEVIELACENASVPLGNIEFIEGQGTGTLLGDTIELEGLSKAKNKHQSYKNCHISSVKGQVGHLGVLSGLVGLFRAIYALQSKQLLGQYNFNYSYSNIFEEKDNKIKIMSKNQAWESKRLLAGVSSFGMTGTNACVILENYHVSKIASKLGQMHLFLIAGKDQLQLKAVKKYIVKYLKGHKNICFGDLSYSLNRLFDNNECRELYAFTTYKELIDQLEEDKTITESFEADFIYLITEIYELEQSIALIERSIYYHEYKTIIEANSSLTVLEKAIIAQYFSFKLLAEVSNNSFRFIGGNIGKYVTKLLSGHLYPKDLVVLDQKKDFNEYKFIKYLVSLPPDKNYVLLTKKEDISNIFTELNDTFTKYKIGLNENPYVDALKIIINHGAHLSLKKHFKNGTFLQDLMLPVFDKKRCWPNTNKD
ncbi:beta-ketoacyl synthase N-terminal-like domain-containing protein [Tenacibaculum tangerinum]|uniref:Beta-ketoacyl synthase N-terminal-like domain-containing protein n=1 Tax=Tenacibaculum tangerinum TaxID=3038772 RepID=A0ABY8L6R5_9FLAO|nr:beta-ketoacyl synthase N-terminal-like domain-containing protein [Tenacibaculum tangerinum]